MHVSIAGESDVKTCTQFSTGRGLLRQSKRKHYGDHLQLEYTLALRASHICATLLRKTGLHCRSTDSTLHTKSFLPFQGAVSASFGFAHFWVAITHFGWQ